MDAKTIIAIVLVVFIVGAAVWLNIRNRKNTSRLREYLGRINRKEMAEVEQSLAISFGMEQRLTEK